MAESSTTISEIGTSFLERDKNYPNVHFEPGLHSATYKEIEALIKRSGQGDFAFIWNREVLERMQKYSPQVIAVDSQSPLSSPGQFALPEYLWVSLPGKPSEVNPETKEVYVVRGDAWGYSNYFADKRNKGVGETMDQWNARQNTVFVSERERGAFILASYVLGSAALISSISEKKVSRRNFLRFFSGTLAGYTLEKLFSPLYMVGMVRSKDARAKDFFIDLANFLDMGFLRKNAINFRTALLIAKEEDAIDHLEKPRETSGAILMGNAHSRMVGELMSKKEVRNNLISDFTEVIIHAGKQAFQKNPSVVPEGEFMKDLLGFISAVEIVRVFDPQLKSDGSYGPIIMDRLDTFQSSQVEEAIAKFR